MPKQPPKKRCSTPSRSTNCAARKRRRAWPVVRRTVAEPWLTPRARAVSSPSAISPARSDRPTRELEVGRWRLHGPRRTYHDAAGVSNTRNEALRIGVVGGGMIAQAMHLPHLNELQDRFKVAALAEPSRAVREALCVRFGIPGS